MEGDASIRWVGGGIKGRSHLTSPWVIRYWSLDKMPKTTTTKKIKGKGKMKMDHVDQLLSILDAPKSVQNALAAKGAENAARGMERMKKELKDRKLFLFHMEGVGYLLPRLNEKEDFEFGRLT